VPRFVTAGVLPWFAKSNYSFHDTKLGRVIEHARHAIAIDEHRKDYEVTMWTETHPFTRSIEQRWFPGAHANVGGGYEDDTLPEIPLLWMAKEAAGLGLEFRREAIEAMEFKLQSLCSALPPASFVLDGTEFLAPVRDSYKEFMFGIYATLKTLSSEGPYYRRMLIETDDPAANRTFGPKQRVDECVFEKLNADPEYRPPNLARGGQR
jgi:hypothetical protein